MELGKVSKSELISEVAERAGISKVLASHVYYKLSEVIEEKLKEGKEVRLPYVGVFYFHRKNEMKSNLTGQMILPHHQLKFRYLKGLARYVRIMTREI